jgi:hypothetical protein
MALAESDPEGRTTLPAKIRKLCADGIIPKCLEKELLIYKPNKAINF